MTMYQTTLSVTEAADRIIRILSADCIDRFERRSPRGDVQVQVLVFERYYMRNGSRASLTVTVTDLSGQTEVCAVGSGGGKGLFLKFDWGAGESFEQEVGIALGNTRL